MSRLVLAPAVDDQPAVLEPVQADPRATAAPGQSGQFVDRSSSGTPASSKTARATARLS